jgi:hypothetical protein
MSERGYNNIFLLSGGKFLFTWNPHDLHNHDFNEIIL